MLTAFCQGNQQFLPCFMETDFRNNLVLPILGNEIFTEWRLLWAQDFAVKFWIDLSKFQIHLNRLGWEAEMQANLLKIELALFILKLCNIKMTTYELSICYINR